MTDTGASGASGERNIKIHPLVLINISDHYTRKASSEIPQHKGSEKHKGAAPNDSDQITILGVIYGRQEGLNVDIRTSMELVHTEKDGVVTINQDHLKKSLELTVAVFPKYELLGWYCTGSEVTPSHLAIHKTVLEHNESPLFLLFNANCEEKLKELPIGIYESETKVVHEVPTMLFVRTSFDIGTEEGERVALDHVSKVAPAGEDSSILCPHLDRVHNSITNIHARTKMLINYLDLVKSGEIPTDHKMLRQIASICNQLPAMDPDKFHTDFTAEYNDTLLVTYLSTLTKGAHMMNDVATKVSIGYTNRRRQTY